MRFVGAAAQRFVRRVRIVVGGVLCFVLPAASWLDGSRTFAWTMYSRSGEFRIDLVTFDSNGRAHQRNPAALAEHATPVEAALLAGSEHWRQGPSMAWLRANLDDFATYACRELAPSSVEVTLHERSGRGGERATTRRRVCGP